VVVVGARSGWEGCLRLRVTAVPVARWSGGGRRVMVMFVILVLRHDPSGKRTGSCLTGQA